MRKISLMAAFLLFAPTPALSCECVFSLDVQEAYDKASSVFVGKVTKAMHNYKWYNTFTIEKAWKGFAVKAGGARQTLTKISKCDYFFENGGKYLIYVDKVSRHNEIKVSNCSLTKPIGQAAEDLEILGPPKANYTKTVIIGQ